MSTPALVSEPAGALSADPPPQAGIPDPDAADASLLADWHRYCDLGRTYHHTRAQLAQLRASLGARLTQMRAALALPGPNGGFDAWLQAHAIPRSSAYRLIRHHQNRLTPSKQNTWVVPRGTTIPPANPAPQPTPGLSLDGLHLSLHLTLTPKQALILRTALTHLTQPHLQPLNLAHFLAVQLGRLTDGSDRSCIEAFLGDDDHHFSVENLTRRPPLAIPVAPGGLLRCRSA